MKPGVEPTRPLASVKSGKSESQRIHNERVGMRLAGHRDIQWVKRNEDNKLTQCLETCKTKIDFSTIRDSVVYDLNVL